MLVTLYRAGVSVWGTDASPAMLDLARTRLQAARDADERLARLPFELVAQPLQDLALPQRFGLILLPLDGFRLLRSPAEQEVFLAAAARHLLLRGRLALDLTLPEAHIPEWLEDGPLPAPDGRPYRSRTCWRQDGDDMVEESTFRRVTESGDEPAGTTCDRYRRVTAADLDTLLAAAGWRVEGRYADFLGTPWQPGDGRLVVVAAPGGSAALSGNSRRP